MFKMFQMSLCFFLLAASFSSCYRMPTDEDYSMIPMTNNRDFTREKSQGLPGVGY